MPSNRHSNEAVLDAVHASVLAVGVRRTTLTEVARRAGVSRMTLYRYYPDVDAVVRDLMTRHFGGILREAQEQAAQGAPHGRAVLVRAIVASVGRLRDDALFRRVLDVDPDLLLPYVTDRLGSTQRLATEFLTVGVDAGQVDGSVRDGDPTVVAHGLLLLAQGFALSARTVAAAMDGPTADAELTRALDGYLRPANVNADPRSEPEPAPPRDRPGTDRRNRRRGPARDAPRAHS